jgi:hypothetical protein
MASDLLTVRPAQHTSRTGWTTVIASLPCNRNNKKWNRYDRHVNRNFAFGRGRNILMDCLCILPASRKSADTSKSDEVVSMPEGADKRTNMPL